MAKKVMIVDDEADLCETVKLLLESKGFVVATALSGPEALEKLRKERVGLVLIDSWGIIGGPLDIMELIERA